MRTRSKLLAIVATGLLGLLGGGAQAQMGPVDVELGYRFTSISGNEDMYRTQVNERKGFVLRALVLDSGELSTGALDSFRLDVSDLGVGPAGNVRLTAGKSGIYKLTASFRQMDHFSALPAFENPFLAQGIVPGQHTQNRVRRSYGVELELLPGRAISPFLGYSLTKLTGLGSTTYSVGWDEFRLTEDVDDTEREFHGGVSIQSGPFAAVLSQGWRKYEGDSILALASGAGNGNGSGTFLGVDPKLTDYTRASSTEATSPITNAVVTVQALDALKIVADYVRTKGDTDAADAESVHGNLVGYEIQRFFKGRDQTIASNAQSTFWKGGVRVEADLGSHVDVTAGFHRSDRELEGLALIDSLYLGTTMYTGFDPRDIRTILEGDTSLGRTEDVLELAVSARGAGPFSVRGGYSRISQDLTIAGDPSSIVIPGGQSGSFDRVVDRFDGAASFSKYGLTLGVDYRLESADAAFVRVDYVDRERLRVRGSYTPKPLSWLKVWGSAEETTVENNLAGSGYDARLRDYQAGLEASPIKQLTFRGSYSKFRSTSAISILNPETFTTGAVSHREDGKAWEGSLTLNIKPFSLEAGYGHFENEGSLAFELDRARVRAEVDIHAGFGLAAEFARDKYEERPFLFGDYEAKRYGVFIRFRK